MTIGPDANAILISGRPVANYADCGEAVPADRAIHNCLACQEPVAISLEADNVLRTRGRDPGIIMAGAMCPDCIRRVTQIVGDKGNISATALGEELKATRPHTQAFYDELKKNLQRPRK